MFIAHLPVGYLITQAVMKRCGVRIRATHPFLLAGLVASVFPDIDLLYFYLVDLRQHHHHTYWTHIPLFWLVTLAISFLVLKRVGNPSHRLPLAIFGLNIFGHLLLDTVVGDIWWLGPWVDQPYAMFTVPARFQPWQLNFLLHWSFGLELLLVCVAYRQHIRNRQFVDFTLPTSSAHITRS